MIIMQIDISKPHDMTTVHGGFISLWKRIHRIRLEMHGLSLLVPAQ